MNEEKLKQKREKCNFYSNFVHKDWCNGKDARCDGWCSC